MPSTNNFARDCGAAFCVSRASQLENTVVTLADCRFEANTAKGNGGGAAFCDSSISRVQNCTFTGNQAGGEGKDTYVDSSSSTSASAPAPPAGSPTQPAEGSSRPGETGIARRKDWEAGSANGR